MGSRVFSTWNWILPKGIKPLVIKAEEIYDQVFSVGGKCRGGGVAGKSSCFRLAEKACYS